MSWKILCPKAKCKDLKMSTFETVDLINKEHWNKVLNQDNIFLTLDYLKALESSMGDSLEFRYLIFYNDELIPVSIAVVQIMQVNNETIDVQSYLSGLGETITKNILDLDAMRLMVCGNIFTTGENGFHFTKDVDGAIAFDNLSKGLYKLRQSEEENGKISFLLLKEFFLKTVKSSRQLEKANFRPFEIDVNMVLSLNKNWNSFEDYLGTMTSKFRTKAKSVLKKSGKLKIKELGIEEIHENSERIYELYLAVMNQASFNFGALEKGSFVSFKEYLGDNFIFKGYFLEGKLIGFSSAFICHSLVDASFVGIDYEYNFEHCLYQRMLYDLVELSISKKVKELRLGRTAEEIKSGIGAVPVSMQLYMRHRNTVSNKLLKPIIESISPSEFEIRTPFKIQTAH